MTNTNTNATTTTTTTEAPAQKAYAKYLTMSPDQVIKEVGGTDRGAISKAIRELAAMGATKGEIAKMTNRRFQQVRNILLQPLKTQQPSAPTTISSAPAIVIAAAPGETKIEKSAPAPESKVEQPKVVAPAPKGFTKKS